MAVSRKQLKELARSLKVTDFADARAFLAAVYAGAKQIDPSYSYAQLSEDLGVGSANAHGIISGKRPLTVKAAEKICEALALSVASKKFFLNLVKEVRAKSASDRDEIYEERLALRQKALPSELDRRQLAFFEHWYHAAILELLRVESAQANAAWIAERLQPSVPQVKVEESLKLLEELGYLALDAGRGRLFPTDATITTGDEVLSFALMSFHRQMLKLSQEALDTIPREDRDISALTLAISPALKDQFKDELIALRKRFLQLSADDASASEVVQVNLQLFPLVKQES